MSKEKVPIAQKRLDFKDLAAKVNKLTDKDVFEEAYNALVGGTEEDKQKFIKLCEDEGLPGAVAEKLWNCWREILEEGTPGWPTA